MNFIYVNPKKPVKRSRLQERQGARGFSPRAVLAVREQEKRSATQYFAVESPLKRSKTQARQGKRGFFAGSLLGVNDHEKT